METVPKSSDPRPEDAPALVNIERHYCGNCDAPLGEDAVFNVPWVDARHRFRRTIAYGCPACSRQVIASLMWEPTRAIWHYVNPPQTVSGDLKLLIQADQRQGGMEATKSNQRKNPEKRRK